MKWRVLKWKKEKLLTEILQENYEIESTQNLSSAIKVLFKDSLQEMIMQNLMHQWYIIIMTKSKKNRII